MTKITIYYIKEILKYSLPNYFLYQTINIVPIQIFSTAGGLVLIVEECGLGGPHPFHR